VVNGPPFVSVIVPVLNGERTIRDCLVSLLRMHYPAGRREILVVDNGSTDRTAEIVRGLPVRYLRENRRGAALARNMGIGASRGEILAFTDADCVVSTGWLRDLVKGFDHEHVGVVAGEVVAYPPKTPAERNAARRKPLWQKYALKYPGSPWFLSGNAAVRRKVFDSVGLFDPRFTGGGSEDIDFAWRFFQCGEFELRYRPKAVVFHRHRASARELFEQRKRYGRGQAILCRKHPDQVSWDWRRELGAYKDLLLTVPAFGRATIRAGLRGLESTECSYLYLELVRKLGERIGFIWGTLQRDSRDG
jgi:glycosyltransferase involved in cell wall biosynthesis